LWLFIFPAPRNILLILLFNPYMTGTPDRQKEPSPCRKQPDQPLPEIDGLDGMEEIWAA
jgi:hypothetical protein